MGEGSMHRASEQIRHDLITQNTYLLAALNESLSRLTEACSKFKPNAQESVASIVRPPQRSTSHELPTQEQFFAAAPQNQTPRGGCACAPQVWPPFAALDQGSNAKSPIVD